MEDREDNDLSRLLVVINTVWETLYRALTHVAENFGIPLRVRRGFIEDVLDRRH